MNAFRIALLLIFMPTLAQFVLGILSLQRRIKLRFEYITIVCCFGQLLFIYLGLKLIAYDAQKQNINCGMPQAALFFAGLVFLILTTITLLVQILIRRKMNKSTK